MSRSGEYPDADDLEGKATADEKEVALLRALLATELLLDLPVLLRPREEHFTPVRVWQKTAEWPIRLITATAPLPEVVPELGLINCQNARAGTILYYEAGFVQGQIPALVRRLTIRLAEHALYGDEAARVEAAELTEAGRARRKEQEQRRDRAAMDRT